MKASNTDHERTRPVALRRKSVDSLIGVSFRRESASADFHVFSRGIPFPGVFTPTTPGDGISRLISMEARSTGLSGWWPDDPSSGARLGMWLELHLLCAQRQGSPAHRNFDRSPLTDDVQFLACRYIAVSLSLNHSGYLHDLVHNLSPNLSTELRLTLKPPQRHAPT